MEYKYFRAFENLDIPYIEYIHKDNSNRKHIIFIHGMFENVDMYKEMADFFYNKGHNIYLVELRNHGILKESDILDFGEGKIESVLKDMNLFISQKLLNVNYRDIVFLGQGLGALISYYLSINTSFKNLILSSMLLEKKIVVDANIIRTTVEMKLNLKKSGLNSYFRHNDFYLTTDKKIQHELKEKYNFNPIASPYLFNDVFRLMKYVKKNLKHVRDDANILAIYGDEDNLMHEDRIKKYLTNINNKIRKIRIIKNEKGRFNNLLERNRLNVYTEIDKWIKNLD